MTEKKVSLHKYAMRLGTIMGVYWIVKFIFFPLGIRVPFLQFVFLAMTIAVPFLGYYFVKMFRNKVLGGFISFAQAWAFTVLLYAFAGILVAVAHYIYFQYIDNGFLLEVYNASVQEVKNLGVAGMEGYIEQLEHSLELISGLTPLQLTFQLFNMNLMSGVFLGIITALFVMRKNPDVNAPL